MTATVKKFWQELRRRKVIRVAVAYAVIAWIVVEVASVLLPTLLLPDWSLRLVTVLVMLGFPIALVLAWVFEMTPSGARLERPADVAPEAAAVGTPIAGVPAQNGSAVAELEPPTGDARRSIVVVPFANLSDETSQAFFSDGMTEEILALLAKQPNLRVVSRTTSFALRESTHDVRSIARKLNVEMVLEGSVRRAGNRVRIMAQLIDPEQDAQLWSDQFDRELTDIFEVQGEIARSIVGALNLDPNCCPKPKVATQELEAYDYYLRGLQYFYTLTESSVDIAREMFQRAIDIDPLFARAYAGLANAESTTAQWFDHSTARLEAADRASRRALELAPGLAEAHSARGYALTLSGDFAEAAREFESALEIEPANYEALYLFARSRFAEGKMAEAAALFRAAHETQPDEFQAITLLEGTLRAMGADRRAACRSDETGRSQPFRTAWNSTPTTSERLTSVAHCSSATARWSGAWRWPGACCGWRRMTPVRSTTPPAPSPMPGITTRPWTCSSGGSAWAGSTANGSSATPILPGCATTPVSRHCWPACQVRAWVRIKAGNKSIPHPSMNCHRVEPGQVFRREGLFADDRPVTIGHWACAMAVVSTPLNPIARIRH